MNPPWRDPTTQHVERDAEGQRLRDLAEAGPDDLPLVLVPDGAPLRSPSTLGLADGASAA